MKSESNNAHREALQHAFDTPWPGPTGEAILLQKGNIRVQVYPNDGARITTLQAFGYEVLRQWEPQRKAFQYGCFPMVPWAGRLGNATLNVGERSYALPANKPPHALHGMACYSPWEIVEKTAESLRLRMVLDSPWPWRGEVQQTLILEQDALNLRLEIISESATFPASAGWHPWFAKNLTPSSEGEELQVIFQPDWQEDDCFGFFSGLNIRLEWPGQLMMSMTSSVQSLVVFDKQPDATCVNPLTQAPNEINHNPQYISPKAPLLIETSWRFKKLLTLVK